MSSTPGCFGRRNISVGRLASDCGSDSEPRDLIRVRAGIHRAETQGGGRPAGTAGTKKIYRPRICWQSFERMKRFSVLLVLATIFTAAADRRRSLRSVAGSEHRARRLDFHATRKFCHTRSESHSTASVSSRYRPALWLHSKRNWRCDPTRRSYGTSRFPPPGASEAGADQRSSSFDFRRALHARSMPDFSEGGAGLCKFQTHVVAEFEARVQGPVLVGRGRYRGYGLFRPVRPKEERSNE